MLNQQNALIYWYIKAYLDRNRPRCHKDNSTTFVRIHRWSDGMWDWEQSYRKVCKLDAHSTVNLIKVCTLSKSTFNVYSHRQGYVWSGLGVVNCSSLLSDGSGVVIHLLQDELHGRVTKDRLHLRVLHCLFASFFGATLRIAFIYSICSFLTWVQRKCGI